MDAKTDFKVPNEQERKNAIGSFQGAPTTLAKALTAITPLFKPVPKPGPSDWLTDHKDKGQTYEAYSKGLKNPVTPQRHTIYIQPLEESIDEEFLKTLKSFTEAFYTGLKVEIRPLINVRELAVDSRTNSWSGKLQYHAGQILKILKSKVPKDAYCMIAVCMTDLYPREAWNFVFGLASFQERVGVFSFARYDENFEADPSEERKPTDKATIIWRSCKVMVHEIGHMFSMPHCIHFHCLMNGSNHFEEASRKPLFLCPVCLRKLQSTIGFDIAERYKGLSEMCLKLGPKFATAANWYQEAYKIVITSYDSKDQKQIEEKKMPEKDNSNVKIVSKMNGGPKTVEKLSKPAPKQVSKVVKPINTGSNINEKVQVRKQENNIHAKPVIKTSFPMAKVNIDSHIEMYKNL